MHCHNIGGDPLLMELHAGWPYAGNGESQRLLNANDHHHQRWPGAAPAGIGVTLPSAGMADGVK